MPKSILVAKSVAPELPTNRPAKRPPINWAVKYAGNSLFSSSPVRLKAIETAGLMWAPLYLREAMITRQTAPPKANEIIGPPNSCLIAIQPMNTMKNVPTNSETNSTRIISPDTGI